MDWYCGVVERSDQVVGGRKGVVERVVVGVGGAGEGDQDSNFSTVMVGYPQRGWKTESVLGR